MDKVITQGERMRAQALLRELPQDGEVLRMMRALDKYSNVPAYNIWIPAEDFELINDLVGHGWFLEDASATEAKSDE